MIRLITFAILTLTLAAPVSFAQTMVIGGGLGRDCYDAAKSGRSNARAERICDRALAEESMTSSNRAATYTNRGVVRMRAGKYDAALNDYSISKRMQPNVGATYLNEGAALIYKKDFNSALNALNRAIELDTKELYAAHYNRAIARENTGDVQGAYADFKRAGELRPNWEQIDRQLSRFTVTEG